MVFIGNIVFFTINCNPSLAIDARENKLSSNFQINIIKNKKLLNFITLATLAEKLQKIANTRVFYNTKKARA